MLILLLAAIATWLVPAGKYDTLSYNQGNNFTYAHDNETKALPFSQRILDSLHIRISIKSFQQGSIRKPVSVPGSYHHLPQQRQSFIEVIQAPLRGIYDSVDIMVFLLMIGGFIQVFYATGAMESGLSALSARMKRHEGWLIIILTFLFCFGGASYGMAEEGLAFYPILTPLFLAAGYDALIPVAVIFGGTQLGTLASFSNPFATIIASNAAGINWTDGLYLRLGVFVASTAFYIYYIVRYANKIRSQPELSLVYRHNGAVPALFANNTTSEKPLQLKVKSQLLLLVFLFTFLVMIGGVIFLDWWLLEMSAVFLVSSVLVALIQRMSEPDFISKFIQGAEGMLGVSLIIATARGITQILNNGNISDSILYYTSHAISPLPHAAFIILLMVLYMVFNLFISSTSGMAVVTMPIIAPLGYMVGVPGFVIVNCYLFGMGIMGFLSPTGLILPNLTLVNVSLKTWIKFIWPFLVFLFIGCSLILVMSL
ncbi:YfcC family protein [Mucilaginibacter koreensis]